MARRQKIYGTCHICGKHEELSFEHIPPKKAFNNRRIICATFDEAFNLGPDEVPKGTIRQGGAGGHTLCIKCNNITGHWYGKYFIDWCYQAMEILIKAGGSPSLVYLNYLFPLPIIKQIITMFFSVNPPEFSQRTPELVRFVLDKERKYLSPRYRFFIYYNTSGKFRFYSVASKVNIVSGEIIHMSELSYTPFGYLMTIDSEPPDNRLFEITNFSKYSYNEFKVLTLHPKVLPTHLLIPGDYRSKKEIDECYKENMKNYGSINPKISK